MPSALHRFSRIFGIMALLCLSSSLSATEPASVPQPVVAAIIRTEIEKSKLSGPVCLYINDKRPARKQIKALVHDGLLVRRSGCWGKKEAAEIHITTLSEDSAALKLNVQVQDVSDEYLDFVSMHSGAIYQFRRTSSGEWTHEYCDLGHQWDATECPPK